MPLTRADLQDARTAKNLLWGIYELKSPEDLRYPICKIAYGNEPLDKIQKEARIIRSLNHRDYIVAISNSPILHTHNGPVAGFQMERLEPVPPELEVEYFDKFEAAVRRLHRDGIVHCFLSWRAVGIDPSYRERVKLMGFRHARQKKDMELEEWQDEVVQDLDDLSVMRAHLECKMKKSARRNGAVGRLDL
jgi:hypothetical protein